MEKYKFSKYNILLKTDNKHTTIYNCYSGGIIKLENDVFRYILENGEVNSIVKYGKELIENGFLVNSNVDEYSKAKLQIERAMNSDNQSTVSYTIAPTLACNLNCEYCFEKSYRDNGRSIISDEMTDKILQFIIKSSSENRTVKNIKIIWFGGEPLLCYEQIISFGKKLKIELDKRNIGLTTSIITNGVLLNESRLQVLTKELNLKKIQITLDGEEETYCRKKRTTSKDYKKVIENILLATKYVKTVVRLNADKSNFHELKKVAVSLCNSKIRKDNLVFHFAQLSNYNHDTEGAFFDDYEYGKYKCDFYETLKRDGDYKFFAENYVPAFSPKPFCGIALKNNFVIDYNGSLYKCEHQIGQRDKIVGNVIDGIYYNAAYCESVHIPINERCRNCNIFPICNYAQCAIMQELTGNDSCECYEKQLEAFKQIAKNYKEVK